MFNHLISWYFHSFDFQVCLYQSLGQRSKYLTSAAEVHGVWNLATNYHGVYFLSTDQLSPTGTDTSRTCTRLCRRDFVLNKYLLFISDIRNRLAHERYLSTYPPSNRDMRYHSKWLQFLSPHATRPTYISPDSPQKNVTRYPKTSRFYREFFFALGTLLFAGNCHLF